MAEHAIQPTTVVGIKRLAHALRRGQGLKHAAALDRASRDAGFENYRHALAQLGGVPRPKRADIGGTGPTYVTAYWFDKAASTGGRETLQIRLRHRWSDLIGPRAFAHTRGLRNFRGQAPDHVVFRAILFKQEDARDAVCAAARTLAFMDITGLQPGRIGSAIEGAHGNRLPCSDHAQRWRDRSGDLQVLTDEPYTASVKGHEAERASWATRNGLCIVVPPWSGMYNPDGGCTMFLIARTENASRLEAWNPAFARLAPGPTVADWQGASAPYSPIFRSPAEVTAGATPRRPPDARLQHATKATVPYSGILARGRRPNARMPIEVHEEVGRVLQEIGATCGGRDGVSSRIDQVRSELDEWVQREYSSAELDFQRFSDMYYHGPDLSLARSITVAKKDEALTGLAHVEALVREHYPDCAPLRWICERLDGARKSLARWSSEPRGTAAT